MKKMAWKSHSSKRGARTGTQVVPESAPSARQVPSAHHVPVSAWWVVYDSINDLTFDYFILESFLNFTAFNRKEKINECDLNSTLAETSQLDVPKPKQNHSCPNLGHKLCRCFIPGRAWRSDDSTACDPWAAAEGYRTSHHRRSQAALKTTFPFWELATQMDCETWFLLLGLSLFSTLLGIDSPCDSCLIYRLLALAERTLF